MNTMTYSLKNKIAVITGGSRGLGEALAYALAKEQAEIVICARGGKALQHVCARIRKNGGACDHHVVDVTKKNEVERFIKTVLKKHKKIDILINNAGWVGAMKPLENITDKEYDMYIGTNLNSVFYFIRAILPIMEKQRSGTIITITSTAGRFGHPLAPIYSASKFGARGLMQAVSKWLNESHIPIKAITVAPGGMNTRMRAKLFGKQDAKKQQSPETVARIITDILTEKKSVPHEGEVEIKNGVITSIV